MKRNIKYLIGVILVVLVSVLALVLNSSFAVPTDWYTNYTYTLDEDNKTITLTKYNGSEEEVTIPSVATINSNDYSVIVSGGTANNALFSNNTDIKKVTFENGVKASSNLNHLFRGCKNLTEVVFNDFDTSATTTMYRMFQNCTSLKKLDLSSFDTSNVTGMNEMFYGSSSLEELNISSFTSESLTSVNMMLFDTPLKKITLGHFNFLYGTEYSVNAYPFARGTWKRLEDGKNYSAVALAYESSTRDISGTYVWQSNVIDEMFIDYPVNYRIEKIPKIDEYTLSDESIFTVIDNGLYLKNLQSLSSNDYTVPGSASLLFKNVVTDANHNTYNLKVTVDNIHLYDMTGNMGAETFHRQLVGLYEGDLYFDSYNYTTDLATKIVNKINPSQYDITMEIVDDNGNPQEGSFVFVASDLDVPSLKDVRDGTATDLASGNKGWGIYSEGLNLLSGYDETTLKTYSNTLLKKTGNRIYGAGEDEDTEFSEFSIKADASQYKFTWTGEGCATFVLKAYQPVFVSVYKQDDLGANIPGASLELYKQNELIDSWISTNEKHEMLLNVGYYTLKEVAPPNENYTKANDINFYVDVDGRILINNSSASDIKVVNQRKNVRVIVKHIDENTNEELKVETNENNKYGDSFTSSAKTFDNYVLTRKPESETVVLNQAETILTYYYVKISGGIVEKHVNVLDNSVLYNENHTGNVGDDYDIPSKTFEGFDLVTDRLPNNSKGEMQEEAIEVIYYYKEKSKVTVKYVDINTNEELAEQDIIEGYVNDDYLTSSKLIPNYVMVETTGDTSGKLAKEDKEVIYYYKKVVYVTTKVNGDGGTITGDETVDYLGASTAEKIVIEADENHFISKITVNGEEINITDYNKMILANFVNMTESKNIIVEFEPLLPDVPKTSVTTILPYIGVGTLALGGLFIYLVYKRKKNNK